MKPTAAALPAFIDIRRLDVEAADGQLSLSMTLAAAVPPGSPTVGLLAYRFYLDTDDDTAWNWYATFELVPEGGYVPVLVDRGGRRLEGPRYPGSAHVAGATITLTVPFESLGCPLTVGVRAAAEQTRGGATRQSLEPAATEPLRRVDAGC